MSPLRCARTASALQAQGQPRARAATPTASSSGPLRTARSGLAGAAWTLRAPSLSRLCWRTVWRRS
eukprot:9848157-Alexandrium_andersonii.AAC.1